jgi:hypothetical protein
LALYAAFEPHLVDKVRRGSEERTGQARHSRIQTTLDIYAQMVSEGQREAARKLSQYVVTYLSQKTAEKALGKET